MTEEQYLLTVLAEECAEVAHRASKAIRFGLDEIQDGQNMTNEERLESELCDLIAVAEMLRLDLESRHAIDQKKEKVEKWMNYSIVRGRLR